MITNAQHQRRWDKIYKGLVYDTQGTEKAAHRAVLPSPLGRGCSQAGWIQQIRDSRAVSATHPPSSQHTLKTGKKGSCKVVFFLYSLTSSFLLSTNVLLLIPLLKRTWQFSISGRFKILLRAKKKPKSQDIQENKFLKCSLPTVGSKLGCVNVGA